MNSDEISLAASVEDSHAEEEADEEEEEVENQSIYKLHLIVDQVRTCLDDLRLIDRSFPVIFDQIEQIINQLDTIIKTQIEEQTEEALEIENVLGDFHFLNTIDDEETSKTIDSGFEGEQQPKQNEHDNSNINQMINYIFVDILNRILILLHVKFPSAFNSSFLFHSSIFKIVPNRMIIFSWNDSMINMSN